MKSQLLPAPMFSVAIVIGAMLAGVAPLAAQPIEPMVREGVTEKISEHVHVIPDASVPLVPNIGIIVGTHGTFVIDTGLGVMNGEAVVREVEKVSHTADLFLATTHFHPEHDLGAAAFPVHTKLLRSTDQQADIDEFGLQLARTFSTRSPTIAGLLRGATFREANTFFEHERTVELGGVRVRLIAMGPNHTRGDTAFFVEPDGVLFSGDIVMKPQPAFASPYSSLRHWLASLDTLEKLEPKRIVPSHGPMGDVALIAGYRAYLTTIQTRTAELKKAGKNVDEAAQAIAAELQEKYPDRGRITGAVRVAFAEAP